MALTRAIQCSMLLTRNASVTDLQPPDPGRLVAFGFVVFRDRNR